MFRRMIYLMIEKVLIFNTFQFLNKTVLEINFNVDRKIFLKTQNHLTQFPK